MADENWKTLPLGECLTLQRGFDLSAAERKPGTVPVVSSSGITGYHASAPVKGPGVVTGRYGTIGQVFYVEQDFWPLNTTLWVKDFKGNNPKFTSFLLRTIDFRSCSDKSSVPGVNRNDLHRILVDLPPLGQQRAIADVLSAFDDKIELNRRMNQTLESMARAIFRSWFVDFDPVVANAAGRQPFGMSAEVAALFPARFAESNVGRLPTGWQSGSILKRASLLSGGTPKTSIAEYWGGQIAWASAADVSQCGECFLLRSERTITARGLEESAAQLIDAFATAIVARGATTGRMCMLGSSMAINQTCYALRSNSDCHFYMFCLAKEVIGDLVHVAHGSVFDTITTQTFESSCVVLPDPRIVIRFEQAVEPMFRKILACQKQSRILAALRDALLPKLMSGELRVRDAEKLVGAHV